MDNEKLFDFMEKMYGEMQIGFTKLEGRIDGLDGRISNLEKGQEGIKDDIRKIDIKLELLNEKIDFSLEGHKSNTEQLTRIEEQVSKHEKFIIQRVV